jgi:hypothetical protein
VFWLRRAISFFFGAALRGGRRSHLIYRKKEKKDRKEQKEEREIREITITAATKREPPKT